MKKDITTMILDSLWLVIMMIGIILAGKQDDMQGYIHCIALIIWYVGARFLFTTWDKSE